MRSNLLISTIVTAGTLLGAGPAAAQVTAQQGLSETSLVAGKTTAFRVVTDPSTSAATNQIETMIVRPDGSRLSTAWSNSQFLSLQNASGKPSLLIRVPGIDLPWVGSYSLEARLADAQAHVLATYSLEFQLLPTKDLHLIVTYLFKGTGSDAFAPTATWDADVQRSMNRLGSMFPVRDGVQNSLNGAVPGGLRYLIGTPCDGYIAGYYDCVYKQTRSINAAAGDHINVSVEFRPGIFTPVCREVPCGPGGNSGRPPAPYSDLPRASCVSGNFRGIEMTAACIGQEVGHNFGLEPSSSPHFQDPQDPGHSKDPFIPDPDAFDFINNRVYVRVGDTMNNLAGGAFQGVDAIMFNAFDWEYLRQQIAKLPNSGPTVADRFMTDVAPAVSAAGNNVYFFARRVDGRVFYNLAALGQAGQGWREMEGNGRTQTAPSAGAVGAQV